MVVAFINAFYPKVMDLLWGFREISKSYTDINKYFGILDYKPIEKCYFFINHRMARIKK
jgi:hypothetical protein